MRLWSTLAGIGFRRWSTYRLAAFAGAFTDSVFGLIRAGVITAAIAAAGGHARRLRRAGRRHLRVARAGPHRPGHLRVERAGAHRHSQADLRRLTERILVVDHGRLAFDGTLAQLVGQVGAERIVVLDLTDPAPTLDGVPGTRLVGVEASGLRQRLSFGPGETTVAAILAAVAQRSHVVHDLTIEEPDIEAVVRRLYAS